jgi:hypothetical protein
MLSAKISSVRNGFVFVSEGETTVFEFKHERIEDEKRAFAAVCYALRDAIGSLELSENKFKKGNLRVSWDRDGQKV